MKKIISDFIEKDISPITTLRTIMLFGRNVSTYKFALADTLLKSNLNSEIKYTDLRNDFLKSLLEHYKSNPNQYQAGSNSLTDAFDEYLKNGNWDELIQVAERNIYNNVFDAFHNVGGSSIKDEHILFEHDKKSKRLIITDNLFKLNDDRSFINQLIKENESRWNIVEEAWKHKLSPNMLVYNDESKIIYSESPNHERVNLRSAVDVLLPYQHSKCFYCNKELNTNTSSDTHNFPDVDHVIPFSAFNNYFFLEEINPNGLWNLVISCMECNRGSNGKFDAPPDSQYYEKLTDRNVLFTEEHRHSLKNTILLSIGAKNHYEVRLNMNKFKPYINLLNGWRPKVIYDE